MPAGKAVMLSVVRTPSGPSCRQSDGKPKRGALPVLPTHRPVLLGGLVRLSWDVYISHATPSFVISRTLKPIR